MAYLDAASPSRLQRVLTLAAMSFRVQWVFFVIPAAYLISNHLLMMNLPNRGTAPVLALLIDLLSFTIPCGAVVMLILRLVWFAVVLKPESPTKQLAADIVHLVKHPAVIINALPVFAAMIFFNKAMVELKPMIPAIKPFAWDETFMSLDRALHFGVDPWVILQPVLGYDWVTFAINIAYNFWFIALFSAWFWFGFQKQSNELRTRFFLAYMLAWFVGGGLLAVFFSSAGPVYYGRLGLSPDPYVALFTYLNDVNSRVPLWFLQTQQMLWDGYTGKAQPLGISAMPSMHNASAILFALVFSRVSRKLGWFFGIYTAIILVGSVHIGWHYAVDGYAGLLVGLMSWWVAGYAARWAEGRAVTRRYNEGLASL